MPKVNEVHREGKCVGYSVFCVACDQMHVMWINNEGSKVNGRHHNWTFVNKDVERPTFTPSLLLRYPDGGVCHSFIENGQWRYLSDCTHSLAGQTVPMVDDE